MGDENGLVAGQGLHVLHHLAQCGGSNCLIEVAGVGGHLAEELILCSIALRELGAFVPFRGNAANAEVGVPCLIAGLVVLGVGRPSIEETVRAHLGGTASLTTAGLVYQERRVAVAQKQIGPADGRPGWLSSHAGLSIAVQINHRPTVAVCRDLIQNISVIHMSGVACTGSVQPVGGGIISACTGAVTVPPEENIPCLAIVSGPSGFRLFFTQRLTLPFVSSMETGAAAPVSAEAAAPPTMVAARTFRKLLRVILFIFIYPFIWFIFRKKTLRTQLQTA